MPVAIQDPTQEPSPGVERIEALMEKVETVTDPSCRELLQECLYSLLDLYGEALRRIFTRLEDGEDAGGGLIDDELIRALLFVHGLHPVPIGERLVGALETVRPYMKSHGGDIELVSLENDVATLRLVGHCESCPSSNATMELAVRQAIEEACPDLGGIEVEGATNESPDSFQVPPGAPKWHILGTESDLGDASLQSLQVNGSRVVLCKVGDSRFAYRDHCPSCASSFRNASLDDFLLTCPSGHSYDIRRAGISPGRPDLHLFPFPLVAAGGIVKIAVT